MDFYQIIEKTIERKGKDDVLEISPDFRVCRSKDLMIRGGSFYAIWDEEKQIWSTDEYDVQRLIDRELETYKQKKRETYHGKIQLKRLGSFSSNIWSNFQRYSAQMADNSHQLDEVLTFSNTVTKKTDYVSKRLPYSLEKGSISAYDEIMGTLYEPEERKKLEWAIGAIVAGEAKHIQKFIVLYGEMGSGKSTFLNIIQKLFAGYYTTFDAKALTNNNNSFSTEVFKGDPLVGIQHDGDLSRIEDNTRLNSIVSHEEMVMNEKNKPQYTARTNCFLFMGTNKPVKITDAKSGIIRRLIDVQPSGNKIPTKRYHILTSQIDFELGAIAWHCLQVFLECGKNYYSNYRPLNMMLQTDVFFNFVESNYYVFKEQNGVTLSQAYEMYKTYCDETLVDFKLPRHRFREELKSYFGKFVDVTRVEGKQIRSYYSDFLVEKFNQVGSPPVDEKPYSLVLDETVSLLDEELLDCPAQYATKTEIPENVWAKVKTKLLDLDTKKLHYVKPPLNHIVIDFDLKDESGNKSVEKNLEAASMWPPTYSEFSKSGAGVHLHYIYEGDVDTISRVYSEGIEIKVFTGNSSLRRKLTKCNSSPIAHINTGLPLKGEKMVNFEAVKSEVNLRNLIVRNLNKEIHSGTKPSVDFIFKILEDAYKSGLKYDISDMRPRILAFANNSSNQAEYCIKLVSKMHFASEEASTTKEDHAGNEFIFFDVEVFPNLFVVAWKAKDKKTVKMINPTASEIEELMNFKLIGFNCRRYDNHILYARYIGYNNEELYKLSQKIIKGNRNAMFGEAYNISYTDVYDFASAQNKMSLKKWQIKLGIHHKELGLPWDKPVAEELWDLVADYCCNDVESTEIVFYHLSGDWASRQILAGLSGLTVNDTTNQHTIRIVFGNNKNTKSDLVYTDLSIMFPGYVFENGVSMYRGVKVGEGGYVYAEPGMYTNVAVIDVGSMHPTSIVELNLFGKYTKNYSDLKDGRLSIKHKDIKTLETLLDGRILPFIESAMSDTPEFTLKDVSNGLKTGLNSGYGLTFASFDNQFRDPRNIDNIVAKRGALFMVDLQHAVQEQGYQVVHIKTDSIKIPNATPEAIAFVLEFGKKYGYEFEHEDTYERFCLVNDAVYIARKKDDHKWVAVGAQFAHPYVFKTLFSHEPIKFEDLWETKAANTALYLDMNEGLLDDEHKYQFIGKIGAFCPVKAGCGGGILLREQGDKFNAAAGSKGYRWLEAEIIEEFGKQADIDMTYYTELVDAAVEDISKFGDIEQFTSDSEYPYLIDEPIGFNDTPPWETFSCWKEGDKNSSDSDNNACLNCPYEIECVPF